MIHLPIVKDRFVCCCLIPDGRERDSIVDLADVFASHAEFIQQASVIIRQTWEGPGTGARFTGCL